MHSTRRKHEFLNSKLVATNRGVPVTCFHLHPGCPVSLHVSRARRGVARSAATSSHLLVPVADALASHAVTQSRRLHECDFFNLEYPIPAYGHDLTIQFMATKRLTASNTQGKCCNGALVSTDRRQGLAQGNYRGSGYRRCG